jgi:ABC-2 type transport system permease protein
MKFLRESWLLFVQRELPATLRNPIWVIIGLFQPLCYMLLFAPLLDGVSAAPGFPPGGVFTVFTPGMMIMMGIYGTIFNGYSLISELRGGIIERFRVTPVSRLALLLSKAVRDVLFLLLQTLLLVLISLPFGIHIDAAGLGLTLVLLFLIGLAMTSCSYALALGLKDENALASLINTLILPLTLLSGIMLPLTMAPAAIRNIARVNLFAYDVDAARQLFLGHFTDSNVIIGFAVTLVLTILTVFWARHAFSQAMT